MYCHAMQPQLAICNIFDQDAERLAEFASLYGFSAIDWSIDPDQPAVEFVSLMGRLAGFEVRYHCRFSDVDVAFADRRGDDSLALLKRTVEQVALAGGKYMTVHIGLNNPTGAGVDLFRAIDNLALLVEHGNRHGVAVALENLTTPLTNDPALFNRIVAESGAFVTIDIGHAHAVRGLHPGKKLYEEYVDPFRERVVNAHVYHTELDGYGHLPPECLWDIFPRLELLCQAPSCDWWVIELQKPEEILRTREFLQSYLDNRSLPQVAAPQNIPRPLVAA